MSGANQAVSSIVTRSTYNQHCGFGLDQATQWIRLDWKTWDFYIHIIIIVEWKEPTLVMAVAQLRPASSISWSTLKPYSLKSSSSMRWASSCLQNTDLKKKKIFLLRTLLEILSLKHTQGIWCSGPWRKLVCYCNSRSDGCEPTVTVGISPFEQRLLRPVKSPGSRSQKECAHSTFRWSYKRKQQMWAILIMEFVVMADSHLRSHRSTPNSHFLETNIFECVTAKWETSMASNGVLILCCWANTS